MSARSAVSSGREFLQTCLAGLPARLHWIFLLFAVPLVLILAIWTPPFQSADEPSHFYRAYQIAQGGFSAGAGTYADAGIEQVYACIAPLPFHSRTRYTAESQACVRNVKWTGQFLYREFSNTAVYAPVGYLPQALGICIGKAMGATVMHTILLARLLNGALALFLCALSIFWCRGGKLAIFAVLLLPMTLSLFASCNQDATLIAFAALAFSLISRQIASDAVPSSVQTGLLALSLLIVVLGRPPYVVLLLVLFVPGLLPRWRNFPAWLTGLSLAGLLAAIAMAWWLTAPASTQAMATLSPVGGTVDAKMQLTYLFHHLGILAALAGYVAAHAAEYAAGVIGMLGWLDTLLPATYYPAMLLVLLAACIAELAYGNRTRRGATILLLAAPLAAAAAVFFVEYLTWNAVGSSAIYGVQGRYLIPPIIALCVVIPHFGKSVTAYRRITLAVVLSQFLTLVCLPQTIITRYYVQ